MDKFNNGGQLKMFRLDVTTEPGTEQGQQWPQAFAPGTNEMLADFLDKRYVGVQLGQDQIINSGELLCHEVLDGLHG
jgi:hypothetical protein